MNDLYSTYGATVSADGLYRYELWRAWGRLDKKLAFVMLNPSTGDGNRDDPTIRRCVAFAKSHGFGAMWIVNLFALRTPHPRLLVSATVNPVGASNDSFISDVASMSEAVCVAWGAHGFARDRAASVLRKLAAVGKQPLCLSVTKDGCPGHPLYLPSSSQMVPYVHRQ